MCHGYNKCGFGLHETKLSEECANLDFILILEVRVFIFSSNAQIPSFKFEFSKSSCINFNDDGL